MNPPTTPPAQITRDTSLSSPPAAPRAGRDPQGFAAVAIARSPTPANRNAGSQAGQEQAMLQQVQPSTSQQPTLAQQLIHAAQQNAASTTSASAHAHAHQATFTRKMAAAQNQTGTQQANITQQQQGGPSGNQGGTSSGAPGQ